ncbi:MAG: VOC family protein [Chloroflexota bacterium]|jgi:catechol 2,3-dioxygenase-like lactoylglutathione lyase family enzyme|nr:VOC family protein [Chloroflexota bacterium]
MAKLKQIAISTQDPDTVANFYKTVFKLEEIGRVDNDSAQGYYLSDGNINLAIMRFANNILPVGSSSNNLGVQYIGFQVEDAFETDVLLRSNDCGILDIDLPDSDGKDDPGGHTSLNKGTKYLGPDGVILHVSHGGYVGT